MVLFVNGCVREHSRTLELARSVLECIPDDMEEIRLYPNGPEGLDGEKLRLREELLAAKVEECENHGPVLADMNAGGIAGAMAVENDMDVFEDWM